MRYDVREFRAVPQDLVPPALREWTPLPPMATRAPTVVERPRLRARHACQMMMVVDQLAIR